MTKTVCLFLQGFLETRFDQTYRFHDDGDNGDDDDAAGGGGGDHGDHGDHGGDDDDNDGDDGDDDNNAAAYDDFDVGVDPFFDDGGQLKTPSWWHSWLRDDVTPGDGKYTKTRVKGEVLPHK